MKIEQPREDNICAWFLLFIEMALILVPSIFFRSGPSGPQE